MPFLLAFEGEILEEPRLCIAVSRSETLSATERGLQCIRVGTT